MRIFINFMILVKFLISCGVQPPATEPAAEGMRPAEDYIDYAAEEKEIVVEYRKDGNTYALAVEDTADMPTCEHANSRQLVFIKNQNKFFVCDQEAWSEIVVKGEKGDPGAQGATGAQGIAGAPGANGTDGLDGDDGQQAPPIPPNQWYDPITGETWLIGSTGQYSAVVTYTQACTGNWRMPTRQEARDAAIHGIGNASAVISGPTSMWTDAIDMSYMPNPESGYYPNAYAVILNISNEVSRSKNEFHGAFCIKN